jgi:uncharacterized membrane protein YfcA
VTAAQFTIVAVAVFAASCMQASIGFGMGMLAAPVVALVDPTLVPGIIIMLATVLTLVVVVKERVSIDLRGTGWALIGRVPGTIVGAVVLLLLPPRGLAVLLACVVLGGVAAASIGWSPQPHRRNLMVAGAASGLLGTATSIGGPPMALVMQGRVGANLRGTMSAFFLVGSLLSLAVLAVTGAVHRNTAEMFLLLVPVAALGYVASRFVNRVMDRERMRRTSIVVSAAGALVLVGQQLFLL